MNSNSSHTLTVLVVSVIGHHYCSSQGMLLYMLIVMTLITVFNTTMYLRVLRLLKLQNGVWSIE